VAFGAVQLAEDIDAIALHLCGVTVHAPTADGKAIGED